MTAIFMKILNASCRLDQDVHAWCLCNEPIPQSQMHDWLICVHMAHLSIQFRIPEGTKICRADPSSVSKFKGSPRFSDLEDWLVKLVILLESTQYRGDDHDRERLLCIPEFLAGKANKCCQHIIHINCSQTQWNFEQVITGLYDCFTHPTTMQDAHNMYKSA